LLSALGTAAATYGAYTLSQAQWWYSLGGAVSMLAMVIIMIFFALVIFGPGLFVATKFGWKAVLSVLLWEFVWLLLLLLLYIALFGNNTATSPPYYPLERQF
jgi:hypothetical protein